MPCCEVEFDDPGFRIGGNHYTDRAVGVAFLAPVARGLAVVIAGNGESALERVVRMLPLMTGMASPDYGTKLEIG